MWWFKSRCDVMRYGSFCGEKFVWEVRFFCSATSSQLWGKLKRIRFRFVYKQTLRLNRPYSEQPSIIPSSTTTSWKMRWTASPWLCWERAREFKNRVFKRGTLIRSCCRFTNVWFGVKTCDVLGEGGKIMEGVTRWKGCVWCVEGGVLQQKVSTLMLRKCP